MRRRELVAILGALILTIGVSAVLFVGAIASDAPAPTAAAAPLREVRPRIFFSLQRTPPPARAVSEVQQRVGPLAALVPFQRSLSDGAREAAGFLLVILLTAGTLVVANDRVVSAYRASLGGWRTQVRVFLSGVAVLGLGLSAVTLAWIVYLGYVVTTARGAAFGVPAALQVGLAAFGVILVVFVAVLAVGFAATAWRFGDLLFRPRALARYQAQVPSAVVAAVGATILYLLWQLPAIGAALLAAVVAYALGTVVTARLVHRGGPGA